MHGPGSPGAWAPWCSGWPAAAGATAVPGGPGSTQRPVPASLPSCAPSRPPHRQSAESPQLSPTAGSSFPAGPARQLTRQEASGTRRRGCSRAPVRCAVSTATGGTGRCHHIRTLLALSGAQARRWERESRRGDGRRGDEDRNGCEAGPGRGRSALRAPTRLHYVTGERRCRDVRGRGWLQPPPVTQRSRLQARGGPAAGDARQGPRAARAGGEGSAAALRWAPGRGGTGGAGRKGPSGSGGPWCTGRLGLVLSLAVLPPPPLPVPQMRWPQPRAARRWRRGGVRKLPAAAGGPGSAVFTAGPGGGPSAAVLVPVPAPAPPSRQLGLTGRGRVQGAGRYPGGSRGAAAAAFCSCPPPGADRPMEVSRRARGRGGSPLSP